MTETFRQFLNQLEARSAFTIIQFPLETEETDYQTLYQSLAQHPQAELLNTANLLLPFLTIEKNFLIGTKRQQAAGYLQEFQEWQHTFKLPTSLNQAHPQDLDRETQVLVHLIRAFVLRKQLILLDDEQLNLRTDFLLGLIPLLKKIAKERQISIILLTTKTDLGADCQLTAPTSK